MATTFPEDSNKVLYVRMDSHLKDRINDQCKRLNITQAAFTKMAIVKFLEEEEKIQAINQRR
jgi:predicted DNA-binding protein